MDNFKLLSWLYIYILNLTYFLIAIIHVYLLTFFFLFFYITIMSLSTFFFFIQFIWHIFWITSSSYSFHSPIINNFHSLTIPMLSRNLTLLCFFFLRQFEVCEIHSRSWWGMRNKYSSSLSCRPVHIRNYKNWAISSSSKVLSKSRKVIQHKEVIQSKKVVQHRNTWTTPQHLENPRNEFMHKSL